MSHIDIKVKFTPIVDFINPDEFFIANVITRDKINRDPQMYDPMHGYMLDNNVWCITNYGRFVRHSKAIQSFDNYHNDSYLLFRDYNNCDDKLDKLKYKLPEIFIKLLIAYTNADTDQIQECCKIYEDSLKLYPRHLGIIINNNDLMGCNTKLMECNNDLMENNNDLIKSGNELMDVNNKLIKDINELRKYNNELIESNNNYINNFNKLKKQYDKLKYSSDRETSFFNTLFIAINIYPLFYILYIMFNYVYNLI